VRCSTGDLESGWEAAYAAHDESSLWQDDPSPVLSDVITTLADAGFTCLRVDIAPSALARARRRLGNTPVVELELVLGGVPRPVFLKLEAANPTGSVKARSAAGLLRSLVDTGLVSRRRRSSASSGRRPTPSRWPSPPAVPSPGSAATSGNTARPAA